MLEFIRKLAKNNKNLNLFSASKELNGVRLFRNDIDLSKIQNLFINYLYFYYNLNQNISTGEVSKDVLKSEVREDAYSVWQSKREKKDIEDKKDNNKKHDVHLKFFK